MTVPKMYEVRMRGKGRSFNRLIVASNSKSAVSKIKRQFKNVRIISVKKV